jgi:hypothetical protein
VCAQHEHVRTLLEALNKYVKYKFSDYFGSDVL